MPTEDTYGSYEPSMILIDPTLDYTPPISVVVGDSIFADLPDGHQLMRNKAYYSLPDVDTHGFFSSLSTFGIIRKDTVYSVPDIAGKDDRRETEPGMDYIYGEEPIVYKEATFVSSNESEGWDDFLNYIGNAYIDSPFTCFREIERYMNWFDYDDEELEFGFTWKDKSAEWKQSNQLRSINKPIIHPSGVEMNYIKAEAPYIYITSDRYTESAVWADPSDGFSAEISEGYNLSSQVTYPSWMTNDLVKRYKSINAVMSNMSSYIDAQTQYLMNTGYRTVLKRQLASRAQTVTRFMNKEFTTMAGGSTISTQASAQAQALMPGSTALPTTPTTLEPSTITPIEDPLGPATGDY